MYVIEGTCQRRVEKALPNVFSLCFLLWFDSHMIEVDWYDRSGHFSIYTIEFLKNDKPHIGYINVKQSKSVDYVLIYI